MSRVPDIPHTLDDGPDTPERDDEPTAEEEASYAREDRILDARIERGELD